MNTNTDNTTTKPYSALISESLPALKRLLSISATSHGWTALIDALANESMDVINTICVIEIIGRQYLYSGRKKPFKTPDNVFKSWAKDLWEYNEKEKIETIEYICGKVDMHKYITNGLHLLGVSLK